MSRQQEDNLLEFDWIIPLTFWLLLFGAGVIFGALVLSPKLDVYWGLQAEHKRNEERLVALGEEIVWLERVAEALQHDPEFQAELAQIDLRPPTETDQPVTMNMRLNLPTATIGHLVESESGDEGEDLARESWLVRQNRNLVNDSILRNKLYLILAGVILFSFVFLQDTAPVDE